MFARGMYEATFIRAKCKDACRLKRRVMSALLRKHVSPSGVPQVSVALPPETAKPRGKFRGRGDFLVKKIVNLGGSLLPSPPRLTYVLM